jgi:hypothetical protein
LVGKIIASKEQSPFQEFLGRGATLAHRCAICDGLTGISRSDAPNLAIGHQRAPRLMAENL